MDGEETTDLLTILSHVFIQFHYLDQLLHFQMKDCYSNSVKFSKLPICHRPRVPKQQNHYDCGVFVMKFMANPAFMNEPMVLVKRVQLHRIKY